MEDNDSNCAARQQDSDRPQRDSLVSEPRVPEAAAVHFVVIVLIDRHAVRRYGKFNARILMRIISAS
jgi:hypothetical protein